MPIRYPKLSIGLPVYNGEKYLAQTLDSLLSQTFTDFELIICDNASTDRTAQICHEYLQKDRRISYYRNQQNLGCARNFNRVLEFARGEYFKWAAYDDLCAPNFIAACIKILDTDSSIILCHTRTKFIDRDGNILGKYNIHLAADDWNPLERFRALLKIHLCYQCYGVIRTKVLRTSPKMGSHAASDSIFLLRLGLFGRFYEIPEYLFFARHHPQQSVSMFFPEYIPLAIDAEEIPAQILPDLYAYSIWFDTVNQNKILLPHWRVLMEYLRSAFIGKMNIGQRLHCLLSVLDEFQCYQDVLIQDISNAAAKYWQKHLIYQFLSRLNLLDQKL